MPDYNFDGAIRQGDVLLIPINEIPEAALQNPVEKKDGRLVIAEGEHSGHAHVLTSSTAHGYRSGPTLFVLVTGNVPVPLDHEEHGLAPVTLRNVDPGAYEYRPQQEYDPIVGWRPVLD